MINSIQFWISPPSLLAGPSLPALRPWFLILLSMKSITHTEHRAPQLPAHPQVCNEEVLELHKNSLHLQEQLKSRYLVLQRTLLSSWKFSQTRSYLIRWCIQPEKDKLFKDCIFCHPRGHKLSDSSYHWSECHLAAVTHRMWRLCPLAAGSNAIWHGQCFTNLIYYHISIRKNTNTCLFPWTGESFPPTCLMGLIL